MTPQAVVSFVAYKKKKKKKCSYHYHGLSQLCILTDDSCVDVLAEGRAVVVDISQVNVYSGHIAERRGASVCSLNGDVVFVGDLVVQRLQYKDVTWGQSGRETIVT